MTSQKFPQLWFQLTHPWGCDLQAAEASTPQENFNSHTREGVTFWVTKYTENLTFQLTHPWGCDRPIYHKVHNKGISTHTPVRVWRICRDGNRLSRGFQLTHPWGCDRNALSYFSTSPAISTHTPVRVWQQKIKELEKKLGISTHTPVRVWLLSPFFPICQNSFQLTHPWGCDYIVACDFQKSCNFNSHTREGVTCNGLVTVPPHYQFQLTHPWGCDNPKTGKTNGHPDFNSHTREGVTWIVSIGRK